MRRRITEALVLSHLDYCDVVYGPCLDKKTEKRVQRVQNSCIRYCYNVPRRSHITPFLNTYSILNMSNRRALKLSSIVFGLRITGIPPYLAKKLIWNDRVEGQKRSLRFPNLITSPSPRLYLYHGSFRFAASKVWNDLPPPIKNIKSIYTFKLKCRQWLMNQQKSSCCWSVVSNQLRALK